MGARIVLEEYLWAKTFGSIHLSAMRTLRKRGFAITLISTDMPSDVKERQAIDQDTGIKIAHLSGSWESACHSETWFTADLEPYKVLYETERVLPDGFEEIESTGYSISPDGEITHNVRKSYRPFHRYVRDPHLQSLSDQRTLRAVELQNHLGIGWRWVNNNGRIYKEYVKLPKPRSPWFGVIEQSVTLWLEEMKQSDFYITPPTEEPRVPWKKRTSRPNRTNGRKKPSRGSGRTHRHTPSSRKSENFPATKQLSGARRDGNGKDISGTSEE